uniref:Endonuclease/exonuclease/phosphatase domain-containing protein n=1 Tax=Daphnia galeata TaxID=27404 RepID=A0A8J2WHY8_9CRUS|nr:unnamed protein product [Daphnia galeata]
MAVDSNAKSRLWNSATTDRKGEELECFILEHGLQVANQSLSSLEFVPGGTPFLDVTLIGDHVICHARTKIPAPESPPQIAHAYGWGKIEQSGIRCRYGRPNQELQRLDFGQPHAVVVQGLKRWRSVVTGNQNMSHCVNHFFPPEPPSLESHRATEKLTESILLNSFISCAPPVTYSELSTAVESLVIIRGGSSVHHECMRRSVTLSTSLKTAQRSGDREPNKQIYESLTVLRPISLITHLEKSGKGIRWEALWLSNLTMLIKPTGFHFRKGFMLITSLDQVFHFQPFNPWLRVRSYLRNVAQRICPAPYIGTNRKLSSCVFGHKGDSALLNICINAVRIPPSLEVLLLGFTIDHRLSWIPHFKRRLEAAKRAFHSLRLCLRATWGFDKKIFRYLYNTSVEPILLYGCSVWSPILSGKKGVGLLRSFQRLFTSSITKAFKTPSTESLLVLSNSIPIDLRVLEITIVRYRSRGNAVFSSATLAPWLGSDPVPLDEFFELLPQTEHTLRIYTASDALWTNPSTRHCCLVSADYSGIVGFENGPLPNLFTKNQATQMVINLALSLASHALRKYGRVEIISSTLSSFCFSLPGMKLSRLQSYRASAGCQIVGSQYSSLFSGLRSIEVSTKSAAKKEAHLLAQSLWTREWVCSSKGSTTRAFFPTPESRGRITGMDPSYPITQVLSGHSFLNVHQHRFKFKASPHCSCSEIPESVSHFLFECPNFANLRHSFASNSVTIT